jgi:hypothetical protein
MLMLEHKLRDYTGAMVAAVIIVLVTAFYLPHIDGIRTNRVLMLGVTILMMSGICTVRYSIPLSILMMFTSAIFYLSRSPSVGNPLYMMSMLAVLYAVGVLMYKKWGRSRDIVYNALCFVIFANVAMQCEQWIGYPILDKFKTCFLPGYYTGLMGNPNETSAMYAICLPLFFRRPWIWTLPIVVLGLVLARTSNGILAAAIVSAVYASWKYGWQGRVVSFAIIPIFLLVFGLYVDKLDINQQMKDRGYVYKVSALVGSVKPFGWGFSQYEYVIPMFTAPYSMPPIQKHITYNSIIDKKSLDRGIDLVSGTTDEEKSKKYFMDPKNNTDVMYVHAHNEYLEFFFIAGYLGVALLMWSVLNALIKGWQARDKTAFFCLLSSCLTSVFFFPWQMIPTAIITVLMITVIHGESKYAPIAVWETKG